MLRYRDVPNGTYFVLIGEHPSMMLWLDEHGRVFEVAPHERRQTVHFCPYATPIPLDAPVQPFDWKTFLVNWNSTSHRFSDTPSF